MDPNWISGVAAAVSAVVAVAAVVVATRANRRSDVANEQSAAANAQAEIANQRSSEALDLQRRIDDRAREFRDVRWDIEVQSAWSGGRYTGVAFRNVGLTPARDVTFVIEVEGYAAADVLTAEEVLPGVAAGFLSDATAWWMRKNDDLMPLSPAFRVHWSSPLGNVDERIYPAKAMFEIE